MTSLDQDLRRTYAADVSRREARELPAWKVAERDNFLTRLKKEEAVKLLEVGAGTGTDALYFSDRGLDVTCIDLTPEMVASCRDKGLTAKEMDVRKLSFEADAFDAVYSINCFLHVPKADFPRALREVHRVLRSRGLFFLGMWGGFDHEGTYTEDALTPSRFFSFFEDAQLQRIASRGFEQVDFHVPHHDRRNAQLHFQSLTLRAMKGAAWA